MALSIFGLVTTERGLLTLTKTRFLKCFTEEPLTQPVRDWDCSLQKKLLKN